jgi:outer membrane lipoprotein SlyB
MNKKSLAGGALAAFTLGLGGCANYTDWAPTVDTYNDQNAQYLSRDMQECKQLAIQASGGGVTQAVTGTAVGGLVGAAAGAAVGAAVGSPGTGAAIGAATGGIGGGVHKGVDSEADYKVAYIRCLKNRGHWVLNY